jgi:hypothetical protein
MPYRGGETRDLRMTRQDMIAPGRIVRSIFQKLVEALQRRLPGGGKFHHGLNYAAA